MQRGHQRNRSRQIGSVIEHGTIRHFILQRQNDISAAMVMSIGKIRNAPGKLTGSAKDMHAADRALREDVHNFLSELKKFKVWTGRFPPEFPAEPTACRASE